MSSRDSKARNTEAVVAAVDGFDLLGISEAATRIENAINWSTDKHDQDDDYFHGDEDYDGNNAERYLRLIGLFVEHV